MKSLKSSRINLNLVEGEVTGTEFDALVFYNIVVEIRLVSFKVKVMSWNPSIRLVRYHKAAVF